MPALFHNFLRNVAGIFSGWNLAWQGLAIGLTAAIVMSGLDWSYYVATRVDVLFRVARPALMLGTFLPVFGTLVVLVVGEFRKKRQMVRSAWAVGQAALLGFLISSGYKAFTGRAHPPSFHYGATRPPSIQYDAARPPSLQIGAASTAALTDTSHGFRFGWLKGGVFWGWPSSHTTVAFAMAACVVSLYPKNKVVVFLALAYALYIGLSVSVTIHWLSEFVAGAIFGSIIGFVVGTSFQPRMNTDGHG